MISEKQKNIYTQQFLNAVMGSNLVEDGVLGNLSQAAINDFISKTSLIFASKGYEVSPYNLMAVRTNDTFTDTFSDWMVIFYPNNLIAVPCSTKPGSYYIAKPENKEGTAVVKEGQYKKVWKLVKNTGLLSNFWTGSKYYLQQVAPITIFRDFNKDGKLDRVKEVSGLFGIFCHSWKNFFGFRVYNLSAGCQVLREDELICLQTYIEIMQREQGLITYTLLSLQDYNTSA